MTEVAVQDPTQALVAQLRSDGFRRQLEAALPEDVSVDRFTRITATALRENTDLLKVDRATLFSAIVKCAQDGLYPDGREAALVKFGDAAVYMPMIGGFRKIAADHGWSIQTRVVYEHDEFDYELGEEPRVTHRPASLRADRGELIGAYAVARHKDGRREIEVLSAEDVEKVRAVSRAKDKGPWKDWTERMYEKSAGRRIFAKLPLGERDERVQRILNLPDLVQLHGGDPAAVMYGPERSPSGDTPPALGPGESPAVHSAPADSSDGAAGSKSPPEPAGDVDENQQAGAVAPPPEGSDPIPPSSAAPAPGEPEPTFKSPIDPSDDPDVLASEQAAQLSPGGSSQHKDRTLREIHELGDPGEQWFGWAIRNYKTDPMKSAVRAFCKVYLPDLYSEVVGHEEAS